jgi:hypothetical protein
VRKVTEGPLVLGVSRLAKPLIAASLRRQMEANLAVLKDLLEERAAN